MAREIARLKVQLRSANGLGEEADAMGGLGAGSQQAAEGGMPMVASSLRMAMS